MLTARPVVYGAIYGVIAYFVMSRIVVPLSATAPGTFSWPVFWNGVLIHAIGVGIPSALAARLAVGSDGGQTRVRRGSDEGQTT